MRHGGEDEGPEADTDPDDAQGNRIHTHREFLLPTKITGTPE